MLEEAVIGKEVGVRLLAGAHLPNDLVWQLIPGLVTGPVGVCDWQPLVSTLLSTLPFFTFF